jgi:hypothetical protein
MCASLTLDRKERLTTQVGFACFVYVSDMRTVGLSHRLVGMEWHSAPAKFQPSKSEVGPPRPLNYDWWFLLTQAPATTGNLHVPL